MDFIALVDRIEKETTNYNLQFKTYLHKHRSLTNDEMLNKIISIETLSFGQFDQVYPLVTTVPDLVTYTVLGFSWSGKVLESTYRDGEVGWTCFVWAADPPALQQRIVEVLDQINHELPSAVTQALRPDTCVRCSSLAKMIGGG